MVNTTNALRADLVRHCLGLDLSFHKAHTAGEMIERLDGDVSLLSGFFSQLVIDLVSNALLVAGVLVLVFREDWRAGLALTLFALAALLTLIRLRALAVPFVRAVRQKVAEFYGFLGEQLAGTEDIRSSGAVGHVMRRFHALLRTWIRADLKASLTGYSMWIVSITLFTAGTVLSFGLGAYLWRRGLITLGTVYLLFNYTELLRRPIEQIRTQLQELQRATAGISRIQELLATRSQLQDGPGAELPAGALSVAFDRVAFAYEDGEPVLYDISFQLAPGQVLGLLGRSGSGKTTMARLLMRLYDPTAGHIRVGGVAVRTPTQSHLRQRIGLVTQNVELLEATVRDNLTFFDDSIGDDRITAVLGDVGLGPWLNRLPHGLDTLLEPGGGGLSAGEAQLLAFARLFLADPGLVVLDEASSRLDPATEALLERAISRLLEGRTAIIIAHRLATVQRADRILIIDSGQILEEGERAALAEDPASRFHHLLQTGLEEWLS
jgi:ATP-binding cassette subfamily B protein